MFCRVCGQDNDESALYCSRDGEVLIGRSDSFTSVSSEINFCKDCGGKVLPSDLYCGSCGSSLYTVEEAQGLNIDKAIKEGSLASGFDIKNLLKYSLIGVGLVLLISLISSSFINTKIRDLVALETDLYIEQNLINFLDLTSLFNISSLMVSFKNNGMSLFSLNLKGMAFIMALLPLLIFTLMGLYISRDARKKEQKFTLKEGLFIALTYGVLIALLSVFASRKTQLNIPAFFNIGDYGTIEFTKRYGFLASLTKASLIALFSLGLGNGLYSFFRGLKTRNFSNLSIASLILMVSSIFTVLFVIFLSRDDGIYYESAADIAMIIPLVQVFIYGLLFINMGSLKLMVEGRTTNLSLFKNMDLMKGELEGIQFAYLGLFISMLGFFLHGRRSKKRGQAMGEIFYAPAIFALGLGILAYLSRLNINVNDLLDSGLASIGLFSLEFSLVSMVLGSFIINSLSSLAGYFLTGQGRELEREGVDTYE